MTDYKDIPIDKDTVVLSEALTEVDGYEAVLQKWTWDGVTAHSLIFKTAIVEELSNEQLERLVTHTGLADGGSITISRRSHYSFVNFNFRY